MVLILIIIFGIAYLFLYKKSVIHESFYGSGISEKPITAYNQGYETGSNYAKTEIDNAINNIKGTQDNKKSCAISDFYTWGRINGIARTFRDYLNGDKFGKACNKVPGSVFNQHHTEDHKIVKNK